MNPTTLCVIFLLCFAAAMQAQPATATSTPVAVAAQPRQTWDTGVATTLEGASTLSGGRESGRSLSGLVLAHLAWTPTVAPAPDTALSLSGYASALGIMGIGPSETFVGNFLTTTNIEARRSVRLYSVWLEARLGDWSLRTGSLLADEDFATTETGASFTNSAFGWPAFISANTLHTGPAFYVPAPGIRLRRDVGEAFSSQIGLYDGDSFDGLDTDTEARRHGLHYHVGGSQGFFVIAETTFTVKSAGTRIKLGAWWHTAEFDDLYADHTGRSFAVTGAAPRSHRGTSGGYAIVEQTLRGETGKPGHLCAYARGGLAPADRNLIAWSADTGIAWLGPLAARPADTLALGFARATFSSRWAASQRDAAPADPVPDFEEVFEASYSAPLTERFTVRPSLQFIRHPGGSTATRDAFLALLRIESRF